MITPRRRGRSVMAMVATTFGVLLLVLATSVAAAMYRQTGQLSASLDTTQRIAEANVRTLSQTQRELLQLRYLVGTDADAAEVRLQVQFVTQRTQESALSYQRNTLGTAELLGQARDAMQTWNDEVLPLVRRAVRDDSAGASTARTESLAALADLESTYNLLVSGGETNRRAQAASVHDDSRGLVANARQLFHGLTALVALALLTMVLGGILLSRGARQRDAASASLVDLNRELLHQAQVVQATNSMVIVTDATGRIEWVNESFEKVTGHCLGSILGRTPGEVLQGPASDPAVVAEMGSSLREGRRFTAELANYTAAGQEFWVVVDVAPLSDEQGGVAGWVGVMSDVTERHEAQLLLEKATRDAELTALEKSTFLTTMSHEIRTPLNAVLGLSELLLLTDLDAEQREYAETAHTSGQHLLALVNNVLDFSALEAGRLPMHDEDYDVSQLLDETMGMFAGQATEAGIDLRLELDPLVPSRVKGDQVRLRQVLVNLVGNALKFTEEGSVVVSVDLHEDQLRFRVRDDGIGIPEWHIPPLFHSFVRGDLSTTRKYGGTGLGLAISRRLVEQMGGTICLTSKVDVGTTVTLQIPLRATAGAASQRDASTAEPALPDLAALRVLVAEDDGVNQTVVVRMLSRFGIDPVVVGNGRLAVDATLAGDFDVVLLDVQMPVMDGLEAIALIRRAALAHEPWVIALTANALKEDRERFLATGMDDYLSKPLTIDALGAALARVRQPRPEVAHTAPSDALSEVV